MRVAKKRGKKKAAKKATPVIKKLHDYGKDPFFVRKAETMKAILKKHGLPQD